MFRWNPADYADQSAAQLAWAKELLQRLKPVGTEAILDFGCGDGKITAAIAEAVPRGLVLGVDSSPEMIAHAAATHRAPNLEFRWTDALSLEPRRTFDIVFSNACLHWVDDWQAVFNGVAKCLRPGGQLIVSCGGKGNADEVLQAVKRVCAAVPWREYFRDFQFGWSFRDDKSADRWLRQAGFVPDRVELVPKDMTHASPAGLAGWFRTTWMPYTHQVPEDRREAFIADVLAEYLTDRPPDAAGRTHVNMVRLEIEATRSV
ncbi:MAG TPA: methyltransferase domain-containing protein [Gemmataceae bacterium]|nr:methyltransferase domain-containing protein [Gemmataceae bacterium]